MEMASTSRKTYSSERIMGDTQFRWLPEICRNSMFTLKKIAKFAKKTNNLSPVVCTVKIEHCGTEMGFGRKVGQTLGF